MKIKNMPENTSINKYWGGFVSISIVAFLTIFMARIHLISGKGYPLHITVISWLIHSAPFMILSFMTARWASQDRNFSRADFICRLFGVLLVYFPYLYMVSLLVKSAETGNMPIGGIIYPLSIPILIPGLYKFGYGVSRKLYFEIFPDERPSMECENRETRIKTPKTGMSLKEMFQKSREAKDAENKFKP